MNKVGARGRVLWTGTFANHLDFIKSCRYNKCKLVHEYVRQPLEIRSLVAKRSLATREKNYLSSHQNKDKMENEMASKKKLIIKNKNKQTIIYSVKAGNKTIWEGQEIHKKFKELKKAHNDKELTISWKTLKEYLSV